MVKDQVLFLSLNGLFKDFEIELSKGQGIKFSPLVLVVCLNILGSNYPLTHLSLTLMDYLKVKGLNSPL